MEQPKFVSSQYSIEMDKRLKTFTLFLLLLQSLPLVSQVTIKGRISEKSGEPLVGVNVFVKGTYSGATTDVNGHFSFTASLQDSSVLVASYIGFEEQEILF